tara:strand:+ start:2070 stop:3779 length:1710 start_codon:yes stop_codon:yes gene_type:complete
MAIQNASDLLVYAKTASAVAQITRIRVLTTDPIEVPDGGTTGTVKINNITNDSGVVSDDISTAASTNTGSTVLAAINAVLTSATYDYVDSLGSDQTDGNYTYRDFTNGAVGIVPTLEIVNGTATLNDDAIIIEIVTPGSSAIFDPVAFSTSASFSTNMDLRDVTNKDSGGWSESLGGLKSFEVSTDILQSINPDVPLDGTDFFDKLKNRSLVDLSFSDRIRNIIRTNVTQSGVDGFASSSGTQYNLQADPFGGSTASKFNTGASTSFKFIKYTIKSARLEGKNVNWSFYLKGSGSTTSATFTVSNIATAQSAIVTKLEGDGSIAQAGVGSQYWNITGLSTSSYTRVSFQMNNISTSVGSESDPQDFRLVVYPGVYNSQNSSEIFLSSWQIELAPEATDYQDPTDITHWQGNALVSSVSFDAGVEDNLTCSATFTGTGNVYPNGLGPELIADTGFDDASYWSVDPSNQSLSLVENGYAKIKSNASNDASYVAKLSIMNPTDFYLLEYTVAQQNAGAILITDGWAAQDVLIPVTVGTHKVTIKAGVSGLYLKRGSANTDIWLSSISLKKVL